MTTTGSERVAAVLARFYDRRAGEEPEHDPEARLRFRKALALAALRPGERVLDLGSKWGGLGVALREAGTRVEYLGLDLGALNVRRAGALGLEVREADISGRLPIEDGSRDCVFCLELLEHLDSQLALLHEIRRVLADGGRAVISVPSPYNWIEIVRELRGQADPEGHLASLTTPVMVNLLALAGLRIERRRGTFIRVPRTMRLIRADNLAARSRLYLVRPDDRAPFAGRPAEGVEERPGEPGGVAPSSGRLPPPGAPGSFSASAARLAFSFADPSPRAMSRSSRASSFSASTPPRWSTIRFAWPASFPRFLKGAPLSSAPRRAAPAGRAAR